MECNGELASQINSSADDMMEISTERKRIREAPSFGQARKHLRHSRASNTETKI
jgi:hypothetical protein